jgi:hypothetical protein
VNVRPILRIQDGDTVASCVFRIKVKYIKDLSIYFVPTSCKCFHLSPERFDNMVHVSRPDA